MCADISRRQTPEEQELAHKRAALARCKARLVQRELEVASLRAELHAFERRYLRIVGSRYAQLDAIEARIAAILARLYPEDHAAQEHAARARADAQASAEAAGAAHASQAPPVFTPSEDLKKLYREVARHIHPDFATNAEDRARRHQFMAEANRAYEEGDETRLRGILSQWEMSPESVEGEGIGADLVRVIRQIAQVEERLRAIDAEIAQLQASELWQLKTKVDEAAAAGEDLLAIMAAQVEEQIAQARTRLQEVQRRREEP